MAASITETAIFVLFVCQVGYIDFGTILHNPQKKAADLSDQWPFSFVSLVKVAYIALDISLDNCTINVLGRPL